MRIEKLETKTIFIIIGVTAVVIAITYFSEWILFLPVLIGHIMLIKFGKKDEVAKCVGYLSLKPTLSFLVFFLVSSDMLERLFTLYSYEVVLAVLWFVPESILTLIIVYVFRRLLREDKVVWSFLVGDIIRWVSLTIEALLPDPFPEPYFYTQLYVLVFFAIFYPSLYAIGGLVAVIKRTSAKSAVFLSGKL